MSIDKLKTKFFTGAWLTDVKHYFSKINEIIDYLNNLVSYSPPYKVYTALLQQFGTNRPREVNIDGDVTDVALEDTINGVWTYSGVGLYTYTKAGMFTNTSKIYASLGVNDQNQNPDISAVIEKLDDNSLSLKVKRASLFTNPSFTGVNGALYIQPIEIRVYN